MLDALIAQVADHTHDIPREQWALFIVQILLAAGQSLIAYLSWRGNKTHNDGVKRRGEEELSLKRAERNERLHKPVRNLYEQAITVSVLGTKSQVALGKAINTITELQREIEFLAASLRGFENEKELQSCLDTLKVALDNYTAAKDDSARVFSCAPIKAAADGLRAEWAKAMKVRNAR